MAKQFLTAIAAQERGMSEAQLMAWLASKYSDQGSMAKEVGLSQPAISDALRRHGYKNECRWVRVVFTDESEKE